MNLVDINRLFLNYTFTYKCQNCKKEFKSSITGEKIALKQTNIECPHCNTQNKLTSEEIKIITTTLASNFSNNSEGYKIIKSSKGV